MRNKSRIFMVMALTAGLVLLPAVPAATAEAEGAETAEVVETARASETETSEEGTAGAETEIEAETEAETEIEAGAEIPDDTVLATINGQELMQGDFESVENQYLALYEESGYDVTDEEVLSEIHNLALDQAIKAILVDQDMEAGGFYTFTEDEMAEFQEMAQELYDYYSSSLMEEFYSYLPEGSEEDAQAYADEVLDYYGYSLEALTQLYFEEEAANRYRESLVAEVEITEDEIEAAYAEHVETDEAAYAEDIEAFETALYYSDDEVWYIPEGYRSFLQIILSADTGDGEEEEIIAGVQGAIDEIAARLENGDDIEALIEEYGSASDNSGSFYLDGGYWIHEESVIWAEAITAAAFGDAVQEPGDLSEPVVGNSGIHLLYYHADVASGAVDLTDERRAVLEEELREGYEDEKYSERVEELLAEAEIVYAD